MKKKLSILFALVLAVSLLMVSAVPAAAAGPIGDPSFTIGGAGTAEWSTEQSKFGDYSAKLGIQSPIDEARVVFPYDGDLNNITGVSFPSYVEGFGGDLHPFVVLAVDSTGDTNVDSWVVQFIWIGGPNEPSENEWETISFDDGSPVHVAGTRTGLPDLTGDLATDRYAPYTTDNTLTDTLGSLKAIRGDFAVLEVKVMIGEFTGVEEAMTAYVDDITINDVLYELEPVIADSGMFTVTDGTYTTTPTGDSPYRTGDISADLTGSWVDTVVLGDFTAIGTGGLYVVGELTWGTTATIDVSGTLKVGQITMSGTAVWVGGDPITEDQVAITGGTITIDSEGVLTAALTGIAQTDAGPLPCTLAISGSMVRPEALVAIERILHLSDNSNPLIPKPDTVELTIKTNTAFLGAATIDLIFDPRVVEALGVVAESSDFDALEVNLSLVIGSDTQIARFLAYQTGTTGVNATGGAVVAVVELKAAGSTMDFSPLALHLETLKDNKGDRIPFTLGAPSFALVGGIGDANRDTYVDSFDLVEIECAILAFPGYSKNTLTMNVDGKDDVDAFDCTYLARHLAGVSDHPLPPLGWMPPWAPPAP